MCGLIFISQQYNHAVSKTAFLSALDFQKWRGPDATHYESLKNDHILIGHNRLSILDLSADADQPMRSRDRRYIIGYNGEIYNHLDIRRQLDLDCRTTSDTETILEGYAKVGDSVINKLEGMFAFVIYDTVTDTWMCARDCLGVKPLYMHRSAGLTVIGSEPGVLAKLCGFPVDTDSVSEWKVARRPCPGSSFYRGLKEVLPGTIHHSDGSQQQYWAMEPCDEPYQQETFEQLLHESIVTHELSDVTNVALLSGGLDSAVITGFSQVNRAYCIGLRGNNEIPDAKDTADTLGRELIDVLVGDNDLVESWKMLVRQRQEPLSVPNEGLIYLVCKQMQADEKVVLTGEGADELLFGYDEIFMWALSDSWNGAEAFLRQYGYSNNIAITRRLLDFVEAQKAGKNVIQFLEDFFYTFHLPGLLRRMDFASMAASKESRVPFVSRPLISYMYRRDPSLKISDTTSKIPLRRVAEKLGLTGALNRKKIGFSARTKASKNRTAEYQAFQDVVLKELQWS